MERAVLVRDIYISDVKLQFILIRVSNILIRQYFQTLYILSNTSIRLVCSQTELGGKI